MLSKDDLDPKSSSTLTQNPGLEAVEHSRLSNGSCVQVCERVTCV